MSYYIRLVSTPEKPNEAAIEIVKKMDTIQFPGCEVSRLKESHVWIAYSEAGNPVGYASMYYLKGENYGYFSRAAIKADHRRRGLHTRLIRCRGNLARRLGWKGVLTYTSTDNSASANSLVNLGFRLYNPQYRWAGKEFLYFMRSF